MILTNRKLMRLYAHYNKKYFKNRLAKVEVRFSPLLDEHGAIGHTHYEARVAQYIRLDKLLRKWVDLGKMTLLHEMVHISLPYKIEHGPRFEREMRRLARLGAFTGLW